jgi:NhaP-type Na+/H+ or K+/H+ antiporter
MAGGIPAGNPDSSFGQKLLALALVVLFATLGGFLTGLLKGMTVKPNSIFKNGINIKPVSKKVTIPVLVGIIVFGSIARNTFGSKIMDHYPNDWAAWIRTVCLSIILLRGGLELDFEGKGLIVVLLTLIPQLSEACTVALVSKYVFGLPIALCFALGFILGAVSPAVLVPSCMILQEQRYGIKKGIPTTLIAASSFDDIIAITIFGVC